MGLSLHAWHWGTWLSSHPRLTGSQIIGMGNDLSPDAVFAAIKQIVFLFETFCFVLFLVPLLAKIVLTDSNKHENIMPRIIVISWWLRW